MKPDSIKSQAVASVSGRTAFDQLGKTKTRVQRVPVRVKHKPGSCTPTLVFRIPRRVGGAVVRNRLRRRLRAIVREAAHEDSTLFMSGDYLFTVYAPVDCFSYSELRDTVAKLLRDLKPPNEPNSTNNFCSY